MEAELQMDWSPTELEEGELSDAEPPPPLRHKFNFDVNGKGVTEHSAFDDSDLVLMEKRANRFGLNNKTVDVFDDELQQLYKSLSIITDEEIRHTQFDTIHIHGTEKMTTNDIFEYFFTHKPLFLEWIDENSCNVVWKDNITAARAMVFYSKSIKYNNVSGELDKLYDSIAMDAVNADDISVTMPPGKWRLGAQHPKSEHIFLRFGNKSDKKLTEDEKLKLYSKKYNETMGNNEINSRISESLKSKIKSADSILLKKDGKNKNPWGDLCKSWGINDSQEVFNDKNIPLPHIDPPFNPSKKSIKDRIGIPPPVSLADRIKPVDSELKSGNLKMRLGKRGHEQISHVSSESEHESEQSSDEDWKLRSKIPRMRMHADDEEDKKSKQRFTERPHARKENSISKITVEIENEPTYFENIDRSSKNVSPKKKDRNNLKSDIRSRLGARRKSSDDDGEDYIRSKYSTKYTVESKIMDKQPKNTVWSRLDVSKKKSTIETDSDGERSENDLRHTLTSSKNSKSNTTSQDLRKRIGKKKDDRGILRIEFDNELYADSN